MYKRGVATIPRAQRMFWEQASKTMLVGKLSSCPIWSATRHMEAGSCWLCLIPFGQRWGMSVSNRSLLSPISCITCSSSEWLLLSSISEMLYIISEKALSHSLCSFIPMSYQCSCIFWDEGSDVCSASCLLLQLLVDVTNYFIGLRIP